MRPRTVPALLGVFTLALLAGSSPLALAQVRACAKSPFGHSPSGCPGSMGSGSGSGTGSATGPTGTGGASGAQGATGTTGTTGTTGAGTTGTSATTGTSGTTGTGGTGGTTGTTGTGGTGGTAGTGATTGSTGARSPGPGSGPSPIGDPGIWHSVFDDEFNASSLNTSVWNRGWLSSGLTGPMNTEEVECYGPGQDVEGGGELDLNLVAKAQKNCLEAGGPGVVSEPYLSGMVNTRLKFSYTYGYLETRVWLPGTTSKGTDWPGVWEVGNPAPRDGEIDVVEGLGGRACWYFHDSTGAGYGNCSGVYAGGWHTFGADWEPGSVTWYFDGVRVGQETTNITGDPMYLIADLAADHTYGGPVAPGTMRIDYVRVWQH